MPNLVFGAQFRTVIHQCVGPPPRRTSGLTYSADLHLQVRGNQDLASLDNIFESSYLPHCMSSDPLLCLRREQPSTPHCSMERSILSLTC